MSYKERPHPHQSDMAKFIPADYVPFQEGQVEKLYGVLSYSRGQWTVSYQTDKPAFGGYIARESIYGSPSYCPNATRHHKKHAQEFGSMPHLVFFANEKSAIQAGFRKCKRCMK